MFDKIRELFQGGVFADAEPVSGGLFAGTVVRTCGEGDFRVIVLRHPDGAVCDDCGNPQLLLALMLKDDGGEWSPLVLMHETKLHEMLQVLAEVESFIRAPDRVAWAEARSDE